MGFWWEAHWSCCCFPLLQCQQAFRWGNIILRFFFDIIIYPQFLKMIQWRQPLFLAVQVSGVEGILQAYVERIHNVRLAGPTLFGPVINKATSIAQETAARKMRKYYVLMIITVMSSYSRFTVQHYRFK